MHHLDWGHLDRPAGHAMEMLKKVLHAGSKEHGQPPKDQNQAPPKPCPEPAKRPSEASSVQLQSPTVRHPESAHGL